MCFSGFHRKWRNDVNIFEKIFIVFVYGILIFIVIVVRVRFKVT